MGAEVFFTNWSAETAKDAFREATEQACYDFGHAGYSGTIAEKDGFVVIPLPEGEKAEAFAGGLIDEQDERVDDKWGPADGHRRMGCELCRLRLLVFMSY